MWSERGKKGERGKRKSVRVRRQYYESAGPKRWQGFRWQVHRCVHTLTQLGSTPSHSHHIAGCAFTVGRTPSRYPRSPGTCVGGLVDAVQHGSVDDTQSIGRTIRVHRLGNRKHTYNVPYGLNFLFTESGLFMIGYSLGRIETCFG